MLNFEFYELWDLLTPMDWKKLLAEVMFVVFWIFVTGELPRFVLLAADNYTLHASIAIILGCSQLTGRVNYSAFILRVVGESSSFPQDSSGYFFPLEGVGADGVYYC